MSFHPATLIVHWPTGPTPCCTEHARQLVGLAQCLGTHVGVTTIVEPAECENCRNEAIRDDE